MIKEGFDIPFETFLGFKGDKEPDIDLNFSGEYQANAHKYTEVILEKDRPLRREPSVLLRKNSFRLCENYFEEHGQHKRYCEINRIVQGCTGIRRTTGQHPGGIIVLPKGEEIENSRRCSIRQMMKTATSLPLILIIILLTETF